MANKPCKGLGIRDLALQISAIERVVHFFDSHILKLVNILEVLVFPPCVMAPEKIDDHLILRQYQTSSNQKSVLQVGSTSVLEIDFFPDSSWVTTNSFQF